MPPKPYMNKKAKKAAKAAAAHKIAEPTTVVAAPSNVVATAVLPLNPPAILFNGMEEDTEEDTADNSEEEQPQGESHFTRAQYLFACISHTVVCCYCVVSIAEERKVPDVDMLAMFQSMQAQMSLLTVAAQEMQAKMDAKVASEAPRGPARAMDGKNNKAQARKSTSTDSISIARALTFLFVSCFLQCPCSRVLPTRWLVRASMCRCPSCRRLFRNRHLLSLLLLLLLYLWCRHQRWRNYARRLLS